MWYAKLIYSSGEEDLVEDGAGFATEDAARDAALYEISCYKQGAEDLEMMGGNEGEIDYDDPEYEVWEEA
jgi:hypothetical protein